MKNNPKARQILLEMLWMLERVKDGGCCQKRISRKRFAEKYKCQDKDGKFV